MGFTQLEPNGPVGAATRLFRWCRKVRTGALFCHMNGTKLKRPSKESKMVPHTVMYRTSARATEADVFTAGVEAL